MAVGCTFEDLMARRRGKKMAGRRIVACRFDLPRSVGQRTICSARSPRQSAIRPPGWQKPSGRLPSLERRGRFPKVSG